MNDIIFLFSICLAMAIPATIIFMAELIFYCFLSTAIKAITKKDDDNDFVDMTAILLMLHLACTTGWWVVLGRDYTLFEMFESQYHFVCDFFSGLRIW